MLRIKLFYRLGFYFQMDILIFKFYPRETQTHIVCKHKGDIGW